MKIAIYSRKFTSKRGLMPFRRTAQSGKQQHKTAPD